MGDGLFSLSHVGGPCWEALQFQAHWLYEAQLDLLGGGEGGQSHKKFQ